MEHYPRPYYYAIPAIKNYRYGLQRIMEIVADKTGQEVDKVLSPSRKDELVLTRHIFSYFCVNKFKYPPVKVSRFLNREHGCVNNSMKVVKNTLSVNRRFQHLIAELNYEFDCTVKDFEHGLYR